MISITQLANKFENALNALLDSSEEWQFYVWANAGKYKKPYRQGNSVIYPINCTLSTATTAIEANVLTMGINGLRLDVLVPTLPPRTNTAQTDSELAKVQNGQFIFVSRVIQILTEYFTHSQSFIMQDENGDNFGCSMVGGVAIPQDIELRAQASESVPLTVSITLNFVLGGINALDVALYMDGERVPYMSFIPSRATTLNTDMQSNDNEQKSIATSSVYGIEFTAPSSTSNPSTAAAYDFIADSAKVNTAHFMTIEWGNQRTDTYLMFVTNANVTARGADFAGLNVTMAKVYGNEEYFTYPASAGVGRFACATSSGTSLEFNILVRTTSSAASVTRYVYIAGSVQTLTLPQLTTGVYQTTVTVTLNPSDYVYDETTNQYYIYMIISNVDNVTSILPLTEGFTYSKIQG